ncbi:hypothetical protein DK880_00704 [Candidatus Cardinium hertigii]|uniref:Uncharacterized protein n=1 Tax=Candidatus Cardinium hertigii TaxID=247481 RepID=A0A2Z3LHN5_9BACT|nr:hypothetical protein DK880_00704 [Candidatus Cardinium hertigii]
MLEAVTIENSKDFAIHLVAFVPPLGYVTLALITLTHFYV